MTSPHEWNPHNIVFNSQSHKFEDEMTNHYQISASQRAEFENIADNNQLVFDIADFNNRIINSVTKVNYNQIKSLSKVKSDSTNTGKIDTFVETPMSRKTMDIGHTDLNMPNVFQSSDRHTDVSPEDVSERWFISIQQAKDTIKRTTQKFLRSAILHLSRRYRADRMYHTKTLRGQWPRNWSSTE